MLFHLPLSGEIKNQVNITHDKTATKTTLIDFTTATTCRRMLGFTSSIQTIDASEGIFSDRAVDITDTFNSLYVRLPNLSNQKVIESNTGRYSNIVAHIPVPLSRNTIFTYQPPNPFCMELNQKSITAIDTSDTGGTIYVLITNTGATDLGTVGSAINAADSVADNSKALVELSNWTDVGGARVCTKGNIGLVMKATSTSKNLKFGVVNVSGGDITIGSGEDIIFHFGVVKD